MGDGEVHRDQEQRTGQGGEHEQPDRALGGPWIGLGGHYLELGGADIGLGRRGIARGCHGGARATSLRTRTIPPTATAARRLRHAAAGTGSKAVRANEVATYADPNPIAASAANSSPR